MSGLQNQENRQDRLLIYLDVLNRAQPFTFYDQGILPAKKSEIHEAVMAGLLASDSDDEKIFLRKSLLNLAQFQEGIGLNTISHPQRDNLHNVPPGEISSLLLKDYEGFDKERFLKLSELFLQESLFYSSSMIQAENEFKSAATHGVHTNFEKWCVFAYACLVIYALFFG